MKAERSSVSPPCLISSPCWLVGWSSAGLVLSSRVSHSPASKPPDIDTPTPCLPVVSQPRNPLAKVKSCVLLPTPAYVPPLGEDRWIPTLLSNKTAGAAPRISLYRLDSRGTRSTPGFSCGVIFPTRADFPFFSEADLVLL